jgi:hypothetical protein
MVQYLHFRILKFPLGFPRFAANHKGPQPTNPIAFSKVAGYAPGFTETQCMDFDDLERKARKAPVAGEMVGFSGFSPSSLGMKLDEHKENMGKPSGENMDHVCFHRW